MPRVKGKDVLCYLLSSAAAAEKGTLAMKKIMSNPFVPVFN
jgi:hypothetical protein